MKVSELFEAKAPSLEDVANATYAAFRNSPMASHAHQRHPPSTEGAMWDNGMMFEFRDWGQWQMPEGVEDDGDYDWEVPTEKTRDAASKLRASAEKLYPGFDFEVDFGEKNWLMVNIRAKKLNEGVDEVAPAVKVEKVGDDSYKLSVDGTAGDPVALLKKIAWYMHGKTRTFTLTSKSGGKIDPYNFKSNGLIVKGAKEAIDDSIALCSKAFMNGKKQEAKHKAAAPERKKEAAKYSAIQQKKRMDAAAAKWGKGTYQRVKIRQVDGDDGYQYNVFVDGRSIMNGLTRSSAEYEADRQRDKIAQKEKLGKYASVKEGLTESFKVHDLSHLEGREAYDETQTNDAIKDGDVLDLGKGRVGILHKAWPIMVSGSPAGTHFHTIDTSWDKFEGGKYKAAAEKAREIAKKK
jgi:hypothetical protein